MSFPQLAGGGGADCGPANPMANLMKQFHQDRSLQQDRFMNAQRGESSKSGFRSNSNIAMQANDRQFTEEFLRDEAPGRMVERPPGAFEFSGLARELESMQAPAAGGDWANEFMQHKPGMHDPNHFEEFEKIYQQHSMHGPAQQHQWHDEFAAFQSNHPGQLEMSQKEREAFEMAFDQAKQEVNWEKEFEAQQADSWAKEFEQQQENSTTSASDKEALARTAAMLLETVDTESNPKFKRSNFMALMHKLRDKEVSIEGNKMVETKGKNAGGDWASEFGQRYEGPSASKSWADDFVQQSGSSTSGNMWKDEFARNAERSWAEDFTMAHNHGESSSAQQQAVPSGGDWAAEFNRATTGGEASQADMEKIFGKGTEMDDWVQQYNENIAHLKTSKDAEWDDMQKDWERFRPEQGLGYRAVNPEYDTYSFMTDNPYLVNPDAIDSVEHTSLADSILALEAKAQLQANDATAWQQLGFRQQENERDGAAIAALRRAVALDPSMLDCWLALAVSYTNENCRADAYDALEQWIMNNEKYQHLARSSGKSRMAADRHAYITNMFLEAARSAPGAEMDADVQVGLGVLFNVSEEYQKAIDCFKAALQSRPQDYMLWNKLGATLANSRDTPGAIEAYFNALEINPSYVRARYNLAISCINLGQNQEAAEHLLTALALQQSAEAGTPAPVMMDDRGNKIPVPSGMSDNIWDSLRMVMFMMNREDLATQCDRRNLDAFRGEFDI